MPAEKQSSKRGGARPGAGRKPSKSAMKISHAVMGMAGAADENKLNPFIIPNAAPNVIPKKDKMACDDAITDAFGYASAYSAFSEGLGFLGFPYLAELTQRAEYRRPSEIIAKEMTRKWMKLVSTGDEDIGDKSDKIKAIESELKRLKVRDVFCKAAEHDGLYGRGQIYIDTGATEIPEELNKSLVLSVEKIGKNSLKKLINVEPIWTYPNRYNATDPLRDDYFKPQSWYVMGKEVHNTRLLTFISREVPDLLKPAYAFAGIALSQLAKPYVDNWLRTRQSVNDAISNFSIMVMSTDLSQILNAGAGDDLFRRVDLFNKLRNNKGLMVNDKNTEDLKNVSMPLGSLDHLQAQAQEHMAAVTGIPLVKLLGVTPSGLNASSDGEIRSFYDWIGSLQEAVFGPNLKKLIDIIQLSLFGEIDQEIGFEWIPLWSVSETESANIRKVDADTDAVLIGAGVIDTNEARTRIAKQENSAYPSLELNPELLDEIEEPDGEEQRAKPQLSIR